jgi:membrane-bound lytic murein transglycosylase D
MRALPEDQRLTYRYHRVAHNDTLAKLAKDFRTTEGAITAFNKIGPNGIRTYDALVIPVAVKEAAEIPIEDPKEHWIGAPPLAPGGEKGLIHRVRSGDSLWRIAKLYGVSPEQLRIANGLWKNSRLRIGQVLRISRGH